LALDEPRDTDETINDAGLTFLVDKQLFEMAKPFCIDFEPTETGGDFHVSCPLFENHCSIAENPNACVVACAI
jgi:Fe-S cluster assembly iron-binding protein IscA